MNSALGAALLKKELRELFLGRALWPLLLVLSLLVGASFRQALELYSEASRAAAAAPELARSLSPFDGVLVPTLGSLYLVSTLLWPFVAIRQLGGDAQSGAIKLWLQLPVSAKGLFAAKLIALGAGWALALAIPLSALALWGAMGGHIATGELVGLLIGHTLYAAVVVCLSLLVTAWSESAPTASLLVLAATLGSWVLDFASVGRDGFLAQFGALSLTAVLRPWERGVFFAAQLVFWLLVCAGMLALALLGLDHGRRLPARLVRAAGVVIAVMCVAALGSRALTFSFDFTENRRNSFAPEEEAALSRLTDGLRIEVFLRPEDPRREDLERAVLAKLRRSVPGIEIRLGETSGGRFGVGEDHRYGEIVYSYAGRTDVSRSTSPREVLPILWGLSGVQPSLAAPSTYPGYPLVASDGWSALWFFGILPILIGAGATARWWWPYQGARGLKT